MAENVYGEKTKNEIFFAEGANKTGVSLYIIIGRCKAALLFKSHKGGGSFAFDQ